MILPVRFSLAGIALATRSETCPPLETGLTPIASSPSFVGNYRPSPVLVEAKQLAARFYFLSVLYGPSLSASSSPLTLNPPCTFRQPISPDLSPPNVTLKPVLFSARRQRIRPHDRRGRRHASTHARVHLGHGRVDDHRFDLDGTNERARSNGRLRELVSTSTVRERTVAAPVKQYAHR